MMASLSIIAISKYTSKSLCSINNIAGGHEPFKQNNFKIHAEVACSTSRTSNKINLSTEVDCLGRRYFHTRKQPVDHYPQPFFIEGDDVCSRHTVAIRIFEVGADGTASIQTILNLNEEAFFNHSRMSGLLAGVHGRTEAMVRNKILWVVAKNQVHVDTYPKWGDIIEIDVWYGASGKHGMQVKWLLRNQSTGHVFARATCKMAMMNEETRRLSKMPDDVRSELLPWFRQKQEALEEEEESPEKIGKLLDQNARHVYSGLKPRWSDFDTNQHVNNIKYAMWMLEAIPDKIMKNNTLCEITIMYKRECGISDVVQSLCHPDHDHESEGEGEGRVPEDDFSYTYTHLLQTEGVSTPEEIVRGRTRWMKKRHS